LPAPTGTVTFKDGAATLGTSTVANGRAVLQVSHTGVGTMLLTAAYVGDANYIGSSAAMTQTVTPLAVTTTTNDPSRRLARHAGGIAIGPSRA